MYQQGGFGFSFRLTPVVKWLLIANAAVFFVMLVAGGQGAALFVDLLAFDPDRLLSRFWGAFTYMFVHGSFGHLFVNMLVLFFFGPPLEGRWGSREFFRFYVIAGLGGVLLSLLFVSNPVIGASAACYGLMLAFAMNWPDAPIYVWGIFPVKAKWLVAFFFVVSLFSAFGSSGGGVAHFAHLGGLLTGFLYLKADWRGSRAMARIRKARPRAPRPLAIVPRDEEEAAHGQSSPRRRISPADERRMLDEVDRVLDKISAEGMASLTADERRLLDEVSRQRRMN